MRLQQFDVAITYKSSRSIPTLTASRAPVDAPPRHTDEDGAIFGIVTESDPSALQRAALELRVMIDHLEGNNVAMPSAFKRSLPAFGLENSILADKKTSAQPQEQSIFSPFPQSDVTKFWKLATTTLPPKISAQLARLGKSKQNVIDPA